MIVRSGTAAQQRPLSPRRSDPHRRGTDERRRPSPGTRSRVRRPGLRLEQLRAAIEIPDDSGAIRAELATALLHGPGIVVVTGAVDPAIVDRATAVFQAMIAEQRAATLSAATTSPPRRQRPRLERDTEVGPRRPRNVRGLLRQRAHQHRRLGLARSRVPGHVQINLVNPGGQAQAPHRDYHLGFMSDVVAEQYPAHAHRLSPMLTLQGAVAHCQMPVESGPTMYLPHSQKYEAGYLAWRRRDFIEYFERNRVQLPLDVGDAVFFNPAVFHAAGTNRTTDVARMANLLQISSAFGRAMETVDRRAMTIAVYPILLERIAEGMTASAVENVVAATAEGYAFPTNLDRDQPVDG